MNAIIDLLHGLTGLFIDDGALALAILAVVLLAAVLALLLPGVPLAAGAVLVVGCLSVLVANVARAARR